MVSITIRRAYLLHLMPMYWRVEIPMSEHAKLQKWKSNGLGEEHPSDIGGDISKGVSDASDDYIFKPGCLLDEGTSITSSSEKAFVNEAHW